MASVTPANQQLDEPLELQKNFKPSSVFEPSFESLASTPTSPDFNGFDDATTLASTQTPDSSPNQINSIEQQKPCKRSRKKGQITIKPKRLRED